MKTIKFKIPDFVADSRKIHILAGVESIGYVTPHDRKIFVKTSRCSQCGLCCKKVKCEKLEKEPGDNERWRCSVALNMPYGCLIALPGDIENCSLKFEEVK